MHLHKPRVLNLIQKAFLPEVSLFLLCFFPKIGNHGKRRFLFEGLCVNGACSLMTGNISVAAVVKLPLSVSLSETCASVQSLTVDESKVFLLKHVLPRPSSAAERDVHQLSSLWESYCSATIWLKSFLSWLSPPVAALLHSGSAVVR